MDDASTRKATIKVCPVDGDPVVFTFEHPGAEYLCVSCGWLGDIFGPREDPATAELVERRDQVLFRYQRERGITPPDQDRPPPSCNGCGDTATGSLDHGGKPPHWYSRTIDGVTEYACSRDCITSGAVMPW